MARYKRPPLEKKYIEPTACGKCKTTRGVEIAALKALGARMTVGYLVHCELCGQEGDQMNTQQRAIHNWNENYGI